MKRMIFHVLQQGSSVGLLWVVCWLPAAGARAADARKGSGPQTNQAAAASKVQEQGPPASPILSVIFDDPNGLFASYSEGISRLDAQNNPEIQKQEIATGVGASAKLEIGDGDWGEGGEEPPKSFSLLSKPAEGIKSALRLNGNKLVPGTSGYVRIFPEGVGNSMAALSSFKNGKVFLNGGIDMFFRYSEEPFQESLMPNIFGFHNSGLHFLVEAHEGTVVARLNDPQDGLIFDTDLDGTADAARVDTTFVNAAEFDPEKFQHLAFCFQTGEDGTVIMKVFFKEGAGPINAGEDADLASMATFRILTDDSNKLFDPGSLVIGPSSRRNPEVIRDDVAAFRLFAPAPAVFPDLAGDK